MTKGLIPEEKSDEFNHLHRKLNLLFKSCDFDENIYQQMVSMLTKDEIKAIENILEMIIKSHPDYDIHKLNGYFIQFFR